MQGPRRPSTLYPGVGAEERTKSIDEVEKKKRQTERRGRGKKKEKKITQMMTEGGKRKGRGKNDELEIARNSRGQTCARHNQLVHVL